MDQNSDKGRVYVNQWDKCANKFHNNRKNRGRNCEWFRKEGNEGQFDTLDFEFLFAVLVAWPISIVHHHPPHSIETGLSLHRYPITRQQQRFVSTERLINKYVG